MVSSVVIVVNQLSEGFGCQCQKQKGIDALKEDPHAPLASMF